MIDTSKERRPEHLQRVDLRPRLSKHRQVATLGKFLFGLLSCWRPKAGSLPYLVHTSTSGNGRGSVKSRSLVFSFALIENLDGLLPVHTYLRY